MQTNFSSLLYQDSSAGCVPPVEGTPKWVRPIVHVCRPPAELLQIQTYLKYLFTVPLDVVVHTKQLSRLSHILAGNERHFNCLQKDEGSQLRECIL